MLRCYDCNGPDVYEEIIGNATKCAESRTQNDSDKVARTESWRDLGTIGIENTEGTAMRTGREVEEKCCRTSIVVNMPDEKGAENKVVYTTVFFSVVSPTLRANQNHLNKTLASHIVSTRLCFSLHRLRTAQSVKV